MRKCCTSKSLQEGNFSSGISLRLLMFFYPSSEYTQPPWVFGLKSLATPALSFPGQHPFSCMRYWGGLVGEQMETVCKSSAMLPPELWARIKSCIWAAFWLWRWHRQEAVQLSLQSQKAIAGKISSLPLGNLHVSLIFILLFLYAALASLHKSPVQQRGEYLWYLSFYQAADMMRRRFTPV